MILSLQHELNKLAFAVLRPVLGGPNPAITPPTGASTGAGVGIDGQVVATAIPMLGADLSAATLVLVGLAAAIGFVRGVRREAITLMVAAAASLIVGWMWPAVASLVNRLWRMFHFAVIERGILAENPMAAWGEAQASAPLLPLGGDAAAWQIGFFVFGLLILGYGATRYVAAPPPKARGIRGFSVLLERVVGAMVGALTGILVSRFVLPRLVPNAQVALLGPGTSLYDRLAPYAPTTILGIVLLLILFGVTGIGGGKPRQKMYQ